MSRDLAGAATTGTLRMRGVGPGAAAPDGARKRPFLVSEELAFEQAGRNGRTIQRGSTPP